MFYCSYINYRGSFNSTIKADFIDEYLKKYNLDILFLVNYECNSLYFDVIDKNDNVFIDKLEEYYTIFKGEVTNNLCNAIIVKKSLGNFIPISVKNNKINKFISKPIIIYNKNINLHVICVDYKYYSLENKLTTQECKNSIIYFQEIIKNIKGDLIVGGNFNNKLNIINENFENKLKSINIFKNYKSTNNKSYFDETYLDDADNNDISNTYLQSNNVYKDYYMNKYDYGITFNNLKFDRLIIKRSSVFDNNIVETLLSKNYYQCKSMNYLYNVFQNLKSKIFNLTLSNT